MHHHCWTSDVNFIVVVYLWWFILECVLLTCSQFPAYKRIDRWLIIWRTTFGCVGTPPSFVRSRSNSSPRASRVNFNLGYLHGGLRQSGTIFEPSQSTGSHRVHCGRHPATKEAIHVGFRKIKWYVDPRGYGREWGCILETRPREGYSVQRTNLIFKAKGADARRDRWGEASKHWKWKSSHRSRHISTFPSKLQHGEPVQQRQQQQ